MQFVDWFNWQHDLDSELIAGDGKGEREAVDMLEHVGAAYMGMEEFQCHGCGGFFQVYAGMEPSYCPFCGAEQETVFTDELDEDGLYVI